MRKQAVDLNDFSVLAAAAVVTAAILGGGAFGAMAGKVTQPGQYDMKNLQKEYALNRLRRDNQTQQILADRQRAQREMRNFSPKSMRALG